MDASGVVMIVNNSISTISIKFPSINKWASARIDSILSQVWRVLTSNHRHNIIMRDDRIVYERLERKLAVQKKNIVIVGSLIGN